MIRVSRVFDAKPGKLSELMELGNAVKIYLASQGVTASIFTEPYGNSGRLHWHVDYDDAKTAHESTTDAFSNQRVQEMRARIETLTEGHEEVSFLFEEE
ncbi:MAG: hypothetical protein IIB26_08935 [Chloroflexi bacterium]|nr:hypothetical protein [Chloroflexota bacterium]